MKFKNDGSGWRDLKLNDGSEELQVSIPNIKETGKCAHPFISCGEYCQFASVTMSRRKLRSLANAILKELDK